MKKSRFSHDAAHIIDKMVASVCNRKTVSNAFDLLLLRAFSMVTHLMCSYEVSLLQGSGVDQQIVN